MKPINFPGAVTIGKPSSMTDEQCSSIQAQIGIDVDKYQFFLTAWKPTEIELQILNSGGLICVKTLSNALPPMAIYTAGTPEDVEIKDCLKPLSVLIAALTYGDRSPKIIQDNLRNMCTENRVDITATYTTINVEGIANALNEAIEQFKAGGFDVLAILANDIAEPDNWLIKKIEALRTYPNAGVVASSLDCGRTEIKSEHVISNWLISKALIDVIGRFNESMFPYGPIDLDYCERANIAGFGTYYVKNCLAVHMDSGKVNEYGYDKNDMVQKYWPEHVKSLPEYRDGRRSLKL